MADGPREFQELDEGCSLTQVHTRDIGEQHNRHVITIAVPEIGVHVMHPLTHHNCDHNVEQALRNRVLGQTPKPTARGLKTLRLMARIVGGMLGAQAPWDIHKLPTIYGGAKAERYRVATERYQARGIDRRSARVTAFIKCEKVMPDSLKPNPDPRVIQFRTPEYCVGLAQYLKPIEERLYNLRGDGKRLPATRVIGKGLSNEARATLLAEKVMGFDNFVIIGIDMSRFDKHCSEELLAVEHIIYKKCNGDPEFARLLSWQLNSKGSAQATNGSKWLYTVSGRRMSGDMNTASGNCGVTTVMVMAWMKIIGMRKWDMLDDGDDCLVIVERVHLDLLLQTAGPTFLEFGHVCKIESVSFTLEGTEWCQSHPIYDGARWRFIRNPSKVLSCATTGVKYFVASNRRPLLNTIGRAELALNSGIPVLQEYAIALMRNAGTERMTKLSESDGLWHTIRRQGDVMETLTHAQAAPVTAAARASFEKAYGMSPEDQVTMEAMLHDWSFQIEGETPVPTVWGMFPWREDHCHTTFRYPLRDVRPQQQQDTQA